MIRIGDVKRDWGAMAIADQKVTVEKKCDASGGINAKLFQLMKDDRYVDVTLRFDDGKQLSCHRCVLASSSNYFDCMFSNGMKESNEDVITVVGVTSTVMSTALEFMYTSKCSCTYGDYIDLMLVANMYEIKDFEDALIEHLVDLDRDKGTLLSLDSSGHEDVQISVLDFLVEVWVFCRRYPVIANSLMVPDDYNLTTPLKDYIVTSLSSSRWRSKLHSSKNLLDLDFESFSDLLRDTAITDYYALLAFKIVTYWLLHPRTGSEETTTDTSQVLDDSSNEGGHSESRLLHLDSLLNELVLSEVNDHEMDKMWGNTPLEPYRNHLKTVFKTHKRKLLIMPMFDWPEKGNGCSFICHDDLTDKTYRLDSPVLDERESETYGTPQLMILDDSTSTSTAVEPALYCVRGLRKNKPVAAEPDENPNGEMLSFLRHKYSFTRRQWIQDPSSIIGPRGFHPPEEMVPLKYQGLIVPAYSNISETQFPFVRLSHDFQKELKDESEEQQEKVDLDKPPELGTKDDKTAASKDVYTDIPLRNIAEVLRVENTRHETNNTDNNAWECRIPNFEVTGMGVYKKKMHTTIGVVLFGNTYAKEGSSLKESKTLLNAVRTRKSFPDGVCESPLSVVSLHGYVFVCASAPFSTLSKKGNLMLRLPRVCIYDPHATGATKEWVSLPTPSCPDLDYASLYYDQHYQNICLVLVQKNSTGASFSDALNKAQSEAEKTAAKNRTKFGKKKTAAGKTAKNVSGKVLSELWKTNGRIVGRFLLKLNACDFFSSKPKNNVSDVWIPLSVSEKTADFLSLGCLSSGEVRITSAALNVTQLTPIQLHRKPINHGSDFEILSFEGHGENSVADKSEVIRKVNKKISWIVHQNSSYDVTTQSPSPLENKLNMAIKGDKSLLDTLKVRKLEHALIKGAPLAPSHPTIQFKLESSYSLESLGPRDSYDYEDYDDDDVYDYPGGYGSSDSDYYYRHAYYDSDADVFDGYLW